MAEESIRISRAIGRSDSPVAPSVASWRRAISVISLISSARTRSRAVRLAFTGDTLAEHRSQIESTARGTAASGLFRPAVHGEAGQQVPHLATDPLDLLLVVLARRVDRPVH